MMPSNQSKGLPLSLRVGVLAWSITFSFCIASAQVSNSQIDAVFDSLKSTNAPGAAVLVVSNGKPVFRRGYGVTDLRTRTPIDHDTDFRLASFTKQFTATCIMLLVHDGKLHYDDHLTDVFPEFPVNANRSLSAICSTTRQVFPTTKRF